MVALNSLLQSGLVTLSCALLCNGAPVDSKPSKVVSSTFNVTRTNPFESSSNLTTRGLGDLSKRSNGSKYVDAPLGNRLVYYQAEVEIGSRNQRNRVLFDTGSSDLWVIASDAQCANFGCKLDGSYSLKGSSTGKNLTDSFAIIYADGTGANGSYVSDTVTFGGATVKNQEFGLAETSSSQYGVLGVGLLPLEATENGTTYDNFPVSLKKQGYINKVAYSLYLNSLKSTTGSILFGGVDNAKYQGDLVELPVLEGDDLAVNISSVSINGQTFSNETSVILDTGSGFSYLPLNVVEGIAKQIGGTYDSQGDGYIVDCIQTDTLTFNFPKNISITVPISNFLYPLSIVDGRPSLKCFLAIKNDYGYGSLGENFLRGAYVKYDLEERTIALAQVKYTTESDIQEL
ncbi:hypothetical protein KGF57_002977 [Candida theae]|uniref:candidapepsin n=1 Tax=Candida theae TaxID=1198502 RepID=A0AAD5FY37_9ASCO|nr:uncharacterized protein KGF57_002977 [Candida theae]KAI5957711.1 hypothetical protein KGF57_002977 [Candida theae]